MTGPVVVDFHAHHFPEGLPDLAATTGDQRWPSLVVDDSPRLMQGATVFRQVRPPCFDVTSRVAELDASGVERQVISPVPVTLVDWAPPKEAAAFLAAQNDGLIDASRRSDGRLLALGAVPLQDPDLAIAEMARIMSAGMVGIEITAMVDGCELDDPRFEPFWAAAAQEQVPVFIHPAHQRIATRRSGMPYEFGIGMLTDTALAAAALVYGGVLDRHADLRIALSHGCGTFGWTHPRLRLMAARNASAAAHLDDLVRSLWVDTLVFDTALLPILVDRFGADHIMFGTDHPFFPGALDEQQAMLRDTKSVASGLHDGCLGANALDFLGLRPEA
ncbi:MAG: amidohydrolase family protein [Acidimicrobiales bacterium]